MNSTNTPRPHHFITDFLISELFTLEDHIEQDPQNVNLRFQQLAILMELEEWQSILQEAEEIAHLDPTQTAVTWAMRGLAYAHLGNFESAHASIVQSLTLNPNDPATHAVQGDVYAMQGHWEAGINAHSKALELDPSMRLARVNRARAYARLGQMAEARADFVLAKPQFQYDWERDRAERHIFAPITDHFLDDAYESVPIYVPDDDDCGDWSNDDIDEEDAAEWPTDWDYDDGEEVPL